MDFTGHQYKIANDGFTVVDRVYTDAEVKAIIAAIESADKTGPLFR